MPNSRRCVQCVNTQNAEALMSRSLTHRPARCTTGTLNTQCVTIPRYVFHAVGPHGILAVFQQYLNIIHDANYSRNSFLRRKTVAVGQKLNRDAYYVILHRLQCVYIKCWVKNSNLHNSHHRMHAIEDCRQLIVSLRWSFKFSIIRV